MGRKKESKTSIKDEAIKDRIITNIKNLFENEEEEFITNQYGYVNFMATVIWNWKIMAIEIKQY